MSYAFELRAVNAAGAGPASDRATATPAPPPAPAKPAGFTAKAGNGQVALNWVYARAAKPGYQKLYPLDATITGYQYRRKAGGAAWGAWTDIPDSAPDGVHEMSYTVTGLSNGVAHTFELRAVNAGGGGPASRQKTATPALPAPAKPAGLRATAGNAQVTLAWTDPNDATITGYQYWREEGSSNWSVWTDIPDSAPGGANAASYTVRSLRNEVEHRFRIRAVNAAGESGESDEATARPAALVAPGAIWFATLKTVRSGSDFGCAIGYRDEWHRDCRNGTVLSEDEFIHDGVTYQVRFAFRGAFRKFNLAFIGRSGAEVKKALGGLTLHVDGTRFAVSDAETAGQYMSWPFTPNPAWTDGGRVTLSLTPAADRAPPTGRPSAGTQVFWSATLTADRFQ